MGDMIDRDAVLAKIHWLSSADWTKPERRAADAISEAIRALPAIVPQPAPRLPDLGAREAALREAAQCAIDNQDCSPWEISEAILNLIGKKPAGPYPAEPAEDVRAGALREAVKAGMRIAMDTPIEQVPAAVDAAILALIGEPRT